MGSLTKPAGQVLPITAVTSTTCEGACPFSKQKYMSSPSEPCIQISCPLISCRTIALTSEYVDKPRRFDYRLCINNDGTGASDSLIVAETAILPHFHSRLCLTLSRDQVLKRFCCVGFVQEGRKLQLALLFHFQKNMAYC